MDNKDSEIQLFGSNTFKIKNTKTFYLYFLDTSIINKNINSTQVQV